MCGSVQYVPSLCQMFLVLALQSITDDNSAPEYIRPCHWIRHPLGRLLLLLGRTKAE